MSDDRLSAFLDGELDDAERRALEARLSHDGALAAELDAVRHSRQLVRGLGPVEPPADFVFAPSGGAADGLAEVVPLDRHRRRRGLLAVAAVTIFFLVLGFASGTRVADVVPPVDDLVDQHAAAAEAMPDAVVDGSFELMPEVEDVDDMGPAMPEMPMVAVYQADGIMQFLYDTDHGPVSVFRQEGTLDAGSLPSTEPMPTEAGMARYLVDAEREIIIIERDGVVFTVVGDLTNHDMVMTAADAVPATDRSVIEQIRRWFGQLT